MPKIKIAGKTVHLPYVGGAKKPAPKPKEPSAKVGNYRAPVDTAGMDPEMKRTMGFGKKKPSKGRAR